MDTIYCTNNTRWIGNESYLYLQYRVWERPVVLPNVLRRDLLRCRGLLVTPQGTLYNNGKVIWRLIEPGLNPYINHTTRLWCHASGKPITAEIVTYEQLRLESIFL